MRKQFSKSLILTNDQIDQIIKNSENNQIIKTLEIDDNFLNELMNIDETIFNSTDLHSVTDNIFNFTDTVIWIDQNNNVIEFISNFLQ